MTHTLCIGLTGRMGAGKGEVAEFLEKLGFCYVSLSDMVREEIARLGKEVDRHQMQDIGNGLRRQGGAGVLGKRVREKIQAADQSRWVIDGIRNPAEVRELKKLSCFYLVGIDAPTEILLERIANRQRSTDRVDREQILRGIEREWGKGEPPEGQQVGQCMAMIDFSIQNDRTLEHLYEELDKIIEQINKNLGDQHE